jgi:hypothetical protein
LWDGRLFGGKHSVGLATKNQATSTRAGTAKNQAALPVKYWPTKPTADPATTHKQNSRRRCLVLRVVPLDMSGLTFEFTRVRKRAKPAVALRVQRRVRRHASLYPAMMISRSNVA